MSTSAYQIKVSTWFKFLFIGRCQVDTWQPLIDLLEPFGFTNLEFSIKITISYELGSFCTRIIIFLWSCKIQSWVATIGGILDHFACSCEINSDILLSLQHNFPHLAQFAQLCKLAIYGFWTPLQFNSYLLSLNVLKSHLEMTPNLIKLVSNFCKGNNILIELFRHNYYLKDVKLMKIII